MDAISQLEKDIPLLLEVHSTPFNLERGSRKFDFWKHLFQMKTSIHSIRALWLDIEEVEILIRNENTLWRRIFFSKVRRVLKCKRLNLQLHTLRDTLEEKNLELSHHLNIVKSKYSDLLSLKGNEWGIIG